MKKILLTLIASIALCGSIFAQYESNWSFNYHDFDSQLGFVAAIQIDDNDIVNITDPGWDALEIAFFVLKNGELECRGNNNYLYDAVNGYGDPYPTLDGVPVYYNNSTTGETLIIKMYDHINNIEYDPCVATLLGEEITILTGEEHYEGWDDPENPIILHFTTPSAPTFTLDIAAVGETNWDNENYRGGYYLVASPVGSVTPSVDNGFLNEDYDLYYFDESNSNNEEWRNYKVENFTIGPGKGYLYASKNGTTLTFTGTPGTDGNVTLHKTEGTTWSGWNLVGNPLGVAAGIGERPFYVMNDNRDGFIAGSGAIQPMEAVLVYTEEDGETLTFTPDNSKKVARLNVNLIQGRGVIDRAVVNFGEGSLPKFQLNPNHTKVYIPQNGKDYAVVSSESMGEMPVNFKAEKSGTYTLSFNAEEVSFTYLHLIDNLTGKNVDLLASPSYTFDASVTDYASRFKLVFVCGNASDDDFAFFSNGSFVISNEGNATLQVIDINGRILNSETINGCASVNIDAAKGVYLLRLINGDNVKVQKVVVK